MQTILPRDSHCIDNKRSRTYFTDCQHYSREDRRAYNVAIFSVALRPGQPAEMP